MNKIESTVKLYSVSKKRGCPTCDGVDAKSCMRCRGKAKLCDWWYTSNGIVHFTELSNKEKDSIQEIWIFSRLNQDEQETVDD